MTQASAPRSNNHTSGMANSTVGGDGGTTTAAAAAAASAAAAAAIAGSGGDATLIASKKRAELEVRAPPLPKITQGFTPLSLLVTRLVQDSFNELQLMIESLTSAGMSSEEKKARIVKYATNTRKEFIKLLVLTMWSSDAAVVSDVIDLKAWLDEQYRVFEGVVSVLCDIRKVTGRARIPNPDLAAAIEVLSTGQPKTDMMKRYVPPDNLTSAEILKILRNINALLAIRLGLHEKLPPHFRDYDIGSGRATFTSADEFEVDLSIGDENPETQLYVIDVRPIFEPAIRPLPPAIFQELEAGGNRILAQRGLEGIYDFLHDYFLTSKIMILFRQAQDMLGGRWTENLKIQQHKRTLVIQYWPHKFGDKSWIEVGVKRGLGENPSRLGVRWVRDGSEMKDVEVPLDVAKLSAETLMKTVIAMHTKHILTTLREKLFKSPLFVVPGAVTLATHPTDSFESYLKIQLTPSRQCKVLVEPITGRYALQKPSERATKVEFDMNSRPTNAHDSLLRFKFVAMQEEVEHRARSMGWEILKTLSIRSEELKANFPSNSRYMLYMRRKSWCSNWIVTFVQQDSSESWWATEILEKPSQWSISAAVRIPTKGKTNVTYRFLENLEKMAGGLISHFVNTRELTRRNVPHRFHPNRAAAQPTAVQIPDLYLRFSSLIKGSWGLDVLRMSYRGVSTRDGLCTIIVLGRTQEPMTQLDSTNIAAEESDVSFHPQSGSYAIRFVVSVGTSVIAQMVEKLHRIERLISFVTIIRRFNLNCLHVSLGCVVFRYSDSPRFSAEINFTGEGDREMKLILPKLTPHIRLQQLLQNHLNTLGLNAVIKALAATLPLLLALDEIEAALPPEAAEDDFCILVRNVDWFRIEYRHKNYVLDIRLRHRRSVLYWYVSDPAAPAYAAPGLATAGDRSACEGLKAVWLEEGEGWEGLKVGVAAELPAIRDVVLRCHNVIWNSPRLLPTPPPQQQLPQQQQQQNQGQGQAMMGRPHQQQQQQQQGTMGR